MCSLHFNSNFLNLIPQGDKSKDLVNFYPISLSNVIYNIITKVIVNIPKHFSPTFEENSGYVECHEILDENMTACEIINSLKTSKEDGKNIKPYV